MARTLLRNLTLHRKKKVPLHAQLTEGLRDLVRTGILRSGDQLPSTRELAADFQISRNTAIAAYDQLIGEGYLEPRPRSGIVVSGALHPVLPPNMVATQKMPAASPAPTNGALLPNTSGRLTLPLPFRPSQPDVRLFPLAVWNRCRTKALQHHGVALLHYQSRATLGLPLLQRALATYLRDSRGLRCEPEQIMVTTGSQQALFLLALLLLQGRQRLAYVEDPGYFGAKDAFLAVGASLVPVPVDEQGLQVPASLPAGAVLYTTPSRQFPTGACLPVARRLALLQMAQRCQAWLIEDDYDGEFRYSMAPVPSMAGLGDSRIGDSHGVGQGRVFYVGSMSKVLFPALRIGYVVLPPPFVEPMRRLRMVADDHGPLLDQATLAEFLQRGHLYSHLRRCRKEYAHRLDAFLQAAKDLALPLHFPHTDGGMNLPALWTRAERRPIDGVRLDGVEVPSLARYLHQPSGPAAPSFDGLLFGFTAHSPAAIRQALRKLQSALL